MEKKKIAEEGDDRAVLGTNQHETAEASLTKFLQADFILALMLPGTVEAV